MVFDDAKPKRLTAVCCKVEVLNIGLEGLFLLFLVTDSTFYSLFNLAKIASAASSFFISISFS